MEVSRVPVGPGADSPLSVVVTVEGPPRVSLPAVLQPSVADILLCPQTPHCTQRVTAAWCPAGATGWQAALVFGCTAPAGEGVCSRGLRTCSVEMCLASSDYTGLWVCGGSPHRGCALLVPSYQGCPRLPAQLCLLGFSTYVALFLFPHLIN